MKAAKHLTPEHRGSCHSWTKGKALSLQEGGKRFLLFCLFSSPFSLASQKEQANSSLWVGVVGERRLESPAEPCSRARSSPAAGEWGYPRATLQVVRQLWPGKGAPCSASGKSLVLLLFTLRQQIALKITKGKWHLSREELIFLQPFGKKEEKKPELSAVGINK